jgi:hypothetical protein
VRPSCVKRYGAVGEADDPRGPVRDGTQATAPCAAAAVHLSRILTIPGDYEPQRSASASPCGYNPWRYCLSFEPPHAHAARAGIMIRSIIGTRSSS